MAASAWTVYRIARLRALWHEGRTAAQISAELQNGITRSAVLGKVHRMGLSVGRPERPSGPGTGVNRAPVKTSPMSQTLIQDRAAPRAAVDLPSGGLGVLTIRSGQCRWPYGDPREGVSFCGRPVARGAFCAGHAERGYRAPTGGLAALLSLADLT